MEQKPGELTEAKKNNLNAIELIHQARVRAFRETRRLGFWPFQFWLIQADPLPIVLMDALRVLSLAPIRAEYDQIILDCPPSLSMLSVNAMIAANAFIIPTPPEYLALEGLVGVMDAVQKIHEGIGDKCRLLGILLTKVDHRRRVTEEIIQIIRDHYRDQVFKCSSRAIRACSWRLFLGKVNASSDRF